MAYLPKQGGPEEEAGEMREEAEVSEAVEVVGSSFELFGHYSWFHNNLKPNQHRVLFLLSTQRQHISKLKDESECPNLNQ